MSCSELEYKIWSAANDSMRSALNTLWESKYGREHQVIKFGEDIAEEIILLMQEAANEV